MASQQADRRTTTSSLRRAAIYTLGAGGVLAIAAAFGPIWIVRAGIALALIAGVLAIRFAWRETRQERIEHGKEIVRQVRSHGEQLSVERQRNLEIVDVLRRANEDSDEEVVKLQIRIGQLRTELSSLRGDNASLKADVVLRDRQIKRLTTDLAAREDELRILKGLADDAEVLSMPRYGTKADWDALPTAEDLWADGNYPTVVDLQRLAYPAETSTDEVRKQA
ncbi:hypothetical protein [Granulicoccus sp. GXG6511]|uniref:hypothetical protein n=1 Tax=Granulicoccus sp. GXG6511 TaxID=3381351 RepID=UPI003D7D8910